MNQTYLSSKYTSSTGTLFSGTIPLSGKKYQKFPSGLVRIDQEFVSAKTKDKIGAARENFNVGNIMPGTETLGIPAYIFPQAAESYDIPGFCKFSVSAYSKEGGPYGQIIQNTQIFNLTKTYSKAAPTAENPDRIFSTTIQEQWLADTATFVGVIEGGERISDFEIELDKRLVSRSITGFNPGTREGISEISVSWTSALTSITRRNFGRYDEFEATQSLIPNY